mmetsp:Transcript_23528/g.33680  ORF Transcript_23528/g.33680 Transcript_23528/m.33680 type:complete len:116 (+) Transcript_23528:1661-2008(+)
MQAHIINKQLPNIINRIGQQTNVPVINIFRALGGSDNPKVAPRLKNYFINESMPLNNPNDGCHPNDLGYSQLARTVLQELIRTNFTGRRMISSDNLPFKNLKSDEGSKLKIVKWS